MVAEIGLYVASPISSTIARIATVMRTPPAGESQFQASGKSAVYQPGASLIF